MYFASLVWQVLLGEGGGRGEDLAEGSTHVLDMFFWIRRRGLVD